MTKSEEAKVKDFYAKQDKCPFLKWARDINKLQKPVCINQGNIGGYCKYSNCPKVKDKKQS